MVPAWDLQVVVNNGSGRRGWAGREPSLRPTLLSDAPLVITDYNAGVHANVKWNVERLPSRLLSEGLGPALIQPVGRLCARGTLRVDFDEMHSEVEDIVAVHEHILHVVLVDVGISGGTGLRLAEVDDEVLSVAVSVGAASTAGADHTVPILRGDVRDGASKAVIHLVSGPLPMK